MTDRYCDICGAGPLTCTVQDDDGPTWCLKCYTPGCWDADRDIAEFRALPWQRRWWWLLWH